MGTKIVIFVCFPFESGSKSHKLRIFAILSFKNENAVMRLPEAFEQNIRQLLGDGAYSQFVAALEEEPPVSVRYNRAKDWAHHEGTPVPWCSDGTYLDVRPTFTFDPLFHAGCYYVQEASSMFLDQVVHTLVKDPVLALDLCAAPGGKSTLLCGALPKGSLLVANEVMRARAQVLAENLIKWGNPGVVVTQNDPEAFTSLTSLFDLILTDVPCSGEGMFRKDEGAVAEWSPAHVELCWQRQRRIVADVWPALKPGGLLVYSTCTYNIKENEENVKWICDTYGAEVLEVPVCAGWQLTGDLTPGGTLPVYRFLPHRTKGEGLFMAVLRKPQEASGVSRYRKGKGNPKSLPVPRGCRDWISASDTYCWTWRGEYVITLPQAYEQEWQLLAGALNVLHAGTCLGMQKGHDLQPAQSLALSTIRAEGCFPQVELSYEQTIAYLKHEAIQLSADAQRGYLLVTYRGAALGFVKNVGNRANNLYPNEWRIRTAHHPEQVITL